MQLLLTSRVLQYLKKPRHIASSLLEQRMVRQTEPTSNNQQQHPANTDLVMHTYHSPRRTTILWTIIQLTSRLFWSLLNRNPSSILVLREVITVGNKFGGILEQLANTIISVKILIFHKAQIDKTLKIQCQQPRQPNNQTTFGMGEMKSPKTNSQKSVSKYSTFLYSL